MLHFPAEFPESDEQIEAIVVATQPEGSSTTENGEASNYASDAITPSDTIIVKWKVTTAITGTHDHNSASYLSRSTALTFVLGLALLIIIPFCCGRNGRLPLLLPMHL